MKIALATDDKHTIRSGPFSESRYYQVIEIRNVQPVVTELRSHPYSEGEKERDEKDQLEAVMKRLKDCGILMGKSFKKESVDRISPQGIDCITTDIEDINQAIGSYLDGQLENFKYFDLEARDYILCSHRTLK